jgi:hypothetical protein
LFPKKILIKRGKKSKKQIEYKKFYEASPYNNMVSLMGDQALFYIMSTNEAFLDEIEYS